MSFCRLYRGLAFVALGLATCGTAWGQGLSPLDHELLADARDGSLDRFDLPSACLIAGGVADERELAARRRQVDAACASAAQSMPATGPADERARQLLGAMHEQLLVGRYDRGASDLRRLLATGDYNCLSSLVVYHELCSQAGLPLTFWAVPGHVYGQAGQARIEPTCRQWPSPAIDLGGPPRRITSVQLVGRFYYNRGISLLDGRQFEAGVAAMQAAWQLDPDDRDARENLLAGLNNWALELAAENRPAATALVARGLSIDPDYAPLVACERFLLQPPTATNGRGFERGASTAAK